MAPGCIYKEGFGNSALFRGAKERDLSLRIFSISEVSSAKTSRTGEKKKPPGGEFKSQLLSAKEANSENNMVVHFIEDKKPTAPAEKTSFGLVSDLRVARPFNERE